MNLLHATQKKKRKNKKRIDYTEGYSYYIIIRLAMKRENFPRNEDTGRLFSSTLTVVFRLEYA